MSGTLSRVSRVLLAAAALVGISSCEAAGRLVDTIRELNAISGEISNQFDEASVQMRLVNGTSLTVWLINSKRREEALEDRRALARRVAESAYARYSARAGLRALNVVFVKSWSLLVFHYNDDSDIFRFDPGTLGGSESPPAPGGPMGGGSSQPPQVHR